jgi:hypothetical protein
MSLLFCLLLAAAGPVEIAEKDIATIFPADVTHIRYLYLDNVEEKERDHHLAVVSFVLNTLSTKKKITKPIFVDKEKTVIRFDLRDYGIDAKAYSNLPVDPYVKKTDKLKALMKVENPIMRTDWFVVKSMISPTYYKLMGVSDLNGFKRRHAYDSEQVKKLKAEQAAIVISSGLARNTRYIKRVQTTIGSVWESRDSASVDYLTDLLSEKYDSVQLLAFNPNGLISYFAADNKGKSLDYLAPDVAVDYTKSFEPDLLVRVSRNCVACHVHGVIPVDDTVRNILKHKDITIMTPGKNTANRLADLFGSELPVKKDQHIYEEALLKATGMDPKTFTHKFIAVYTIYYANLTLETAAKEVGMKPEDFKQFCLQSGNPHLVRLVFDDKITRVHFESAIEAK